jgi:hypothetical protein
LYFNFSQANFSFAPLVLDMLNFLMDAIQTNFQQASAVGSSSRAQQALSELHTVDKVVEMTDQLMVSVSGSRSLMGIKTSNLIGMPVCTRFSEEYT